MRISKQAIESLKCKHEHLIIIIDNGSTDGTKEWCEQYKPAKNQHFKYIRHEDNIGVGPAWNEGILESFKFDENINYVLVSNNDVIYHPETINNLIKSLDKHPDWGMATACNQRAILADPQAIKTMEIPAEQFNDGPDFACFMIRKSAYEKIGGFDENFIKGFFEDNDYHYRMEKLGIPAMSTTLAPYYHFGSRTQNQRPGGIVDAKQFDANRQYYVKKHGGGPGSEQW